MRPTPMEVQKKTLTDTPSTDMTTEKAIGRERKWI